MITDRIKELCDARGTNMTALCKEITGSSGNTATWNKDRVRSDWLREICKKLDVSSDYLLELSDEQNILISDNSKYCFQASSHLSKDETEWIIMHQERRDVMHAGIRIKEMRNKYGYRQADLASLIGCSAQVISNIERGVTDISADVALKIADVFHTPVEEFLAENRPASVILSPEEYSLLSDYRKLLPNERKLLLQMFGLFMANQK